MQVDGRSAPVQRFTATSRLTPLTTQNMRDTRLKTDVMSGVFISLQFALLYNKFDGEV